jgi:hypothetical protein
MVERRRLFDLTTMRMLHWSHEGRLFKLGNTMAGIRIFLLGSKDGLHSAVQVDVFSVNKPQEYYRFIAVELSIQR